MQQRGEPAAGIPGLQAQYIWWVAGVATVSLLLFGGPSFMRGEQLGMSSGRPRGRRGGYRGRISAEPALWSARLDEGTGGEAGTDGDPKPVAVNFSTFK